MDLIMLLLRWAEPADRVSYKAARGRRRDFLELASVYGLILLVIWTPQPWQEPIGGVAALLIIAVIAVSYEGARPMGLSTENLVKSLWGVALAVTIAVIAVWVAGRMHTLHVVSSPLWA